ncbi:unnamed protein product [Auanema sp. JU1783]|nr:unnamed protein product [Auanema sp. JU1783]
MEDIKDNAISKLQLVYVICIFILVLCFILPTIMLKMLNKFSSSADEEIIEETYGGHEKCDSDGIYHQSALQNMKIA